MSIGATVEDIASNLPAAGFLAAVVAMSGWVIKVLIEAQKSAAANLAVIVAERDRAVAMYESTRTDRDLWFARATTWNAQLIAAGIVPIASDPPPAPETDNA